MLDMSRYQHTTINPSRDRTPTREILNKEILEFCLRCAAPLGHKALARLSLNVHVRFSLPFAGGVLRAF